MNRGNVKWQRDDEAFKAWIDGTTGARFVDANMKAFFQKTWSDFFLVLLKSFRTF